MATKVQRRKVSRKRNPISDAELEAIHLGKTEPVSDVLYAEGAYGRKPTIKDWEAGKDFHAINPPIWKGTTYFSISEAEFIYSLGYHHIIFGGDEGFEVELVMNP